MGLESNSGSREVPPASLVHADQLVGEDEKDTVLLREMLQSAKNYIQSFRWCDSILQSYFGGGVGKIFAIFLFKISTSNPEVDPWEWIMVGDVPSAYLPLEDAASPKEAFQTYLEGMRRWVAVARQGREPLPEDSCPPVNAPATPEWAENLNGRLRMLEELLTPFFD